MENTQKAIRLSKVAREFNVGISTIIDFLLKKGLKSGNKIHNRINIPQWIKAKKKYKVACVRGLIDTDGSFYSYKHRANDKIYNNFAICFTNHSVPLLESVSGIFNELKLKASRAKWRVYLYKSKDIELYVKRVGSSNLKHIRKYENYIKRRGTEVAITGRS